MTTLEITLILVGIVFLIGSFMVKDKLSKNDLDKIADMSAEELKVITEKEIKNAELAIDGMLDEHIASKTDETKRDLENIRRKNDNNTNDILHLNYYNFLFSKDTGIIIVNGDKGKEGIIERTNKTITEIFGYDKEELKGMNVSSLMPKSIERKHKNFINRIKKS